MPDISFSIDETHAVARLEAIGPDARAALKSAVGPLVAEILGDARSRAEAHIRFLGGKPGAYLASIGGGVSEKNSTRVIGYVRSGSPIAHLLEFGAHTPPHDILPKVANILAFQGDAGMVFAHAVHSPGATIPAYPAITPAFAARANDVVEAMENAVRQGAAGR